MKKTLLLQVPTPHPLLSVPGGLPFCLWTIVEHPLLYHWFDFAVDERFHEVKLHCPDTVLFHVQEAVEEATLWPIEINLTPIKANHSLHGFSVDTLPHTEVKRKELTSYQDCLNRQSFLNTVRLDYLWDHVASEHPHYLIGRHTKIGKNVKLQGPYWIGDSCKIGNNVT